MSSNSNPTPCNRLPFVSDDGCDRGSVDIHRFDELPYCGDITPTQPKIPPEIVATPINLPVPPACSCINIKYKTDMKYSGNRSFSAKSDFRSEGDCCEGNYTSTLNLQVPCPVDSDGNKKISASIKYGDGDNSRSVDYISTDKDQCTIKPLNPVIDLQIPCPIIDSLSNTISASIEYGEGPGAKSVDYISKDGAKCTIKPLNPTIDLQIPCPVRDSNPNTISASIAYGEGPGAKSVDYMSKDGAKCTIVPLDPKIDLQIPCPIRDSKPNAISASIAYGNGVSRKSVDYISKDNAKCTLVPLNPTIDLQIPCPVKFHGDKEIKASIKIGDKKYISRSKYLTGIDSSDCQIIPADVNIDLDIPCPILGRKNNKKIRAAIEYGLGANDVSASFIKADPKGCTIDIPDETELLLNIPCPISGTGGRSISVKGHKAQYCVMDPDKCTVDFSDVNLDFEIPTGCTGVGIYRNRRSLRFKKLSFGVPTAVTSPVLATRGCDVYLDNTVDISLNVPCAIRKGRLKIDTETYLTDRSSSWGLKVESDSSSGETGCKRRIKMKVSMPSKEAISALGGGGGMFRWTWNGHTGNIGPGGCMIGRRFYGTSGVSGKSGNTSYYLKVTLDNSGTGPSLEIVETSGATSDKVSYIPIYTVSGGRISVDYRGCFVVPVWE